MGRERIHWQDLPTKFEFVGLSGFNVLLVGDRWDEAAGTLDIGGLSDISETEEAKVFLASPLAQIDPPIMRVFEPDVADKPDRLFVLTERDGDVVLARIVRGDLTSRPDARGP